MDTNAIPDLVEALKPLLTSPSAPAVQSTLNAWHVIALGAGAGLVHGYHLLKDAGGLRTIWRNILGPKTPTTPIPATDGVKNT